MEQLHGVTGCLSAKEASVGALFASFQATVAENQQLHNERKSLNLRLEQKEAEISALISGAKIILDIHDFRTAARAVYDYCKNLVGAKAGYVALLNQDGSENEVLFLDAGGLRCTVNPNLPMPIRGLRAEAYRTGKAVYDNHFSQSHWNKFIPEGHVELKNVMFAPLKIKQQTLGLIGLAQKPQGFTDNDARIATAFGELAAISLLNSRTFDSLKDSQAKLQQERERLFSLLEEIPVSVNLLSRDFSIPYTNRSFRESFGDPKDLFCYQLHCNRNTPCPDCKTLHVFRDKTPQQYRWDFDETGESYSISDLPFTDIDGSHLVLKVGVDITQAKQAEKSLEEAKQLAEDANLAKSSFLASVSHELRTPLASIIGFTKIVLEQEKMSSDSTEYLQIISRNSDHLLSLLDDLLDLTKIEANQLTLQEERISVTDELTASIAVIQPRLKNKDIELKVNYLGPIPEYIITDARRLRQILINVLGNAAKFTERGRISVTVGLNICIHPSQLEFTVSDSGIGIDEATRNILFTPFAKGRNNHTDEQIKGTGLGLALSRNLVRQMGGDIHLVSTVPEEGSVFRITLPAKGMDSGPLVVIDESNSTETISGQTASWSERIEGRLKGRKLIVAEDDPDMQVLLNLFLERAGASVKFCMNGKEVVESVLSEDCDVVLMDIEMPHINGDEATELLRKKGITKPIIALTAHALREERRRCLEVGCDDYLSKPVSPELLIETVERHSTPTP